jgi:hypothetical protein
VKIEPRIDRGLAARDALPQAALKLRQSWRLRRIGAFLARTLRHRLGRRQIRRCGRPSVAAAAQWFYAACDSAPKRAFIIA